MRFELRYVEFMPKALEAGVLYVSEKYATAAHLCACGCGEKIRTPLGPTEWSVKKRPNGPSLWPSVGSWQRSCRSHYVIEDGAVNWVGQWSDAQVVAGRRYEKARREAYYESKSPRFSFWRWLRNLFR